MNRKAMREKMKQLEETIHLLRGAHGQAIDKLVKAEIAVLQSEKPLLRRVFFGFLILSGTVMWALLFVVSLNPHGFAVRAYMILSQILRQPF